MNGPDGVHMTLSREGRPSGEAYIELVEQDDIAKAEKKHNQHMGRRYIEGRFQMGYLGRIDLYKDEQLKKTFLHYKF